MSESHSKTIKNSIIYGLGNFSVKAVGFVLVPLYTAKLSVPAFGTLSLFDVTSQVLLTILSLGLNYAVERWFWDKTIEKTKGKMLFSVLLMLLSFQAIFVTATIFFNTPLSFALTGIAQLEPVWNLLMIVTSLEVIASYFLSIIKLNQKPLLYVFANIGRLCTSLTLTVIFIVHLKLGISGIYWAQLAGFVPLFLITLPFILKQLQWGIERTVIKPMLAFSLPYIFTGLGVILTSFADVYMLKTMAGIEATGIYTLGLKVANFVKVFLVSSIQLAVTPSIFKMEHEPNARHYYSDIMTNYSSLILLAVVAVGLFGEEIIHLLAKNSAYYPAAWVIIPVLIAILFNFMKDIAGIGVTLKKETIFLSAVNICAGVLNVLLNYLFIKELGFIGVAISSVVCQISLFSIILYRSQKSYPIPYQFSRLFLLIGTGVTLCILSLLIPAGLLTTFTVKPAILLIFLLVLIFFTPNAKEKIRHLKGVFNKKRN